MPKQKQKSKTVFKSEKAAEKSVRLETKLRIVNKFIAVLILGMSIYYVISINNLSIQGFVIQQLKAKVKILANDRNKTELNMMALESYDYINQRAESLKMVKIDNVSYIVATNGEMAKK
jgi:cell division protein FtsB